MTCLDLTEKCKYFTRCFLKVLQIYRVSQVTITIFSFYLKSFDMYCFSEWVYEITDFSSKFSITLLSFWHKADWVECQLNLEVSPLNHWIQQVRLTQFGRAYSQSQLYIPIKTKKTWFSLVNLVKSWKFEICNLTDFLDSVKENLIHITDLRRSEDVI